MASTLDVVCPLFGIDAKAIYAQLEAEENRAEELKDKVQVVQDVGDEAAAATRRKRGRPKGSKDKAKRKARPAAKDRKSTIEPTE